jgi:hypothetical protein
MIPKHLRPIFVIILAVLTFSDFSSGRYVLGGVTAVATVLLIILYSTAPKEK